MTAPTKRTPGPWHVAGCSMDSGMGHPYNVGDLYR